MVKELRDPITGKLLAKWNAKEDLLEIQHRRIRTTFDLARGGQVTKSERVEIEQP